MQVQNQEKEIIKSDITNISKFITSSNEDTQNYSLFNETLFHNHNNWLEKIKSQIRKSIKGKNANINFSDINYDKDMFNILKKISQPNDYRNAENINNININKEDLDKLDKLTDFNDIIESRNTCSKYKRESLIAKIHGKNNNENNNEINNNDQNNSDNNNRITFNDNKIIDEDIIMEDIISSTQKVKLDSFQMEKENNSLCTIIEQPSLEEMKKSLFSNQIISNNLEDKNKTGNYVLELNSNNNITNVSNGISNKSANNKPLKLFESIITPKKEENNIIINTNSNQQFSFNKKVPEAQTQNININKNNEITFNFSSNKKYLFDLSSNKKPLNEKINLISNSKSHKDNEIIDTPTLNPNNHLNSNNKVENNINNNNNIIDVLTNAINKATEEEKEDYNINNNNILFNPINTINTNKNYVQDIVLISSTKKNNELKNKIKNKKNKYEDDFEEYELSDSSKRGEEEEEYEDDDICGKFIPKWAKDKEYISSQLNRQNNNKELVFKSFGNFVVEHLNLNMIFETHNEVFDIRNSTADWRGDDSWTKNKVTDVNDNEGLIKDTNFAKSIGMTSKAAIHPNQIEAINSIFVPSKKMIDWAVRVDLAAKQNTTGVFSLDGKMVDKPVMDRARKILAKASRYGLL